MSKCFLIPSMKPLDRMIAEDGLEMSMILNLRVPFY